MFLSLRFFLIKELYQAVEEMLPWDQVPSNPLQPVQQEPRTCKPQGWWSPLAAGACPKQVPACPFLLLPCRESTRALCRHTVDEQHVGMLVQRQAASRDLQTTSWRHILIASFQIKAWIHSSSPSSSPPPVFTALRLWFRWFTGAFI